MSCDSGTNSKGELLALWIILFLARHLNLDDICIYGDSKVFVDWEEKRNNVNILHLSVWMKHTRLLMEKFKNISFFHIFQDQNHLVGSLSKKALQVEESYVFFEL